LLHVWMRLAGTSPFSVRALSAFSGVLLVALLYAAGRRLSDRRSGVLAAVAGIASPFVLNYAREARMYNWEMMLAAFSMVAFLRVLDRSDTGRRWWLAYIVIITLGVSSQYVFAIIPAAQIVSAVVLDRRRSGRWIVAGLAAVVLSLPWMLFAGSQVSGLGADRLGEWDWALIGRNSWKALQYIVIGQMPSGTLWESITVVGLIVLAGTGCIALLKQKRAAAASLILAAAGALGVITIVKVQPGEDLARVIKLAFVGMPALFLLVGTGISRLGSARRWVGFGAIALLTASQAAGILAVYDLPAVTEEDYRPLIAQVQAMAQPDDAILAVYAWQRGYFASYAPEEPVQVYGSWPDGQNGPEFAEELLDAHDRLWVVSYLSDVHDNISPLHIWLKRNAMLVFEQWYGNTQLSLFLPTDELPDRLSKRAVLDDDTSLAYAPLRMTVLPGDAIQFSLRWRPGERLEPQHKVLVHLGTPGTEPVAQNDLAIGADLDPEAEWPPAGYILERYALLVPEDTPPGEYYVYVGVYDPEDQVRLGIADPAGCDDADRICIGRVKVIAPR